ncbi:metallophosphatase family protein [Ligilactobacillus sp. WILCCON 0076]|uniref:Metallophosphatase family protein n=1 Tax=Ligilactobacillus ubinensis TaxID=2876789 RepID=A0A9X2FL11_9LACO|nr:metallophosphoesterase family protein [Ligilactobacillus ubinensis]MCP0887330.1 metallophosphatase family protein [Ligilactobacillus ubinensis]
MKNKIAILSDVHGNLTAFEEVLKDAKNKNVTEYWFLGDIFSPGPGAQKLWDLLIQHNPSVCIRGNWDDLFVACAAGIVPTDDPTLVYISKLMQSVCKHLNNCEDVTKIIKNWPLQKIVKRNGLNIGIVHNLPEMNYGQRLYPTVEQKNFDELFNEFKEGRQLDIVIYAHTHHPLLRYSSEEQLVINPGSIGQPFSNWKKLQTDLRAQYIILEIDSHGIANVEFQKVSYDYKKEAAYAKALDLPYLELYSAQLETGEAHTHDQKLLHQLNLDRGYLNDVIRYNANQRKKFS